MSYREHCEMLEDLIHDLLDEVNPDDPFVMNDDGESLVLPTRIIVILSQLEEAVNNGYKAYSNQSGN